MRFITFYCAFSVLYIVSLSNVYATERHHHHETVVQNNSIQISGTALAIAASQHHYKATSQLQWSTGAGYINDKSAVSFGLGIQAGKVFVSGNFSSDGSSSAIGIGASGTF